MMYERGDLVRIINAWSLGEPRGKLGVVINGGTEGSDMVKVVYESAISPHWIAKDNLVLLCSSRNLQDWKDLEGER